MNIYLDEYHGKGFFDKTYKFYFYEQGSNKLIMSTSLDKRKKVTVHVLNLSTSKGYYFKIVPNNQTNILMKNEILYEFIEKMNAKLRGVKSDR